MDNQIGKVIKSYEVEELIGMGSFGAVYRARQAVVEREVAIKIIWPAFANHPNFIRRFETEAQLVAGLEHPYIVPLYDYWRDPEGAYIVMRWLRGGHLRGQMMGAPVSVADTNRILGQLSAALALAHRYGVVHRDIKPENILLDEENNAYLADFGIAQIIQNANEEEEMAGLGSPAYAAPEQIKGEVTSEQCDLYSLGVIAWEMLAGRHPFPELEEFSMTEMLEYRLSKPLPSILEVRPELPEAIDEVLQTATSLDPSERYPDALSFTQAFRDATAGSFDRMATSTFRAVQTAIPNPYKGLRAFQEADANNFFGREDLVARLVGRMREEGDFARFLCVVGPSGSGKSSVVRAGLVPSLRRGALPGSENWYYDQIVPGPQPFQELANSLISQATHPPANLLEKLTTDTQALAQTVQEILPDDDETEFLLFIDQFEEVFTLVEEEADTERFLESLYNAISAPDSRMRLVITIRADFYDRPLLQPGLSDMVRDRTEVVVPLTPSELERAVVEPARRVGVMIDSGLVAAIVAEVKEQPGALPLLQYSLSELFERRQGNLISADAYREIGGVRGALAKRAEEIYSSLDAHQQEKVRQLFLRLITLGEGTEDTRRRAMLYEVTTITDDDDATDDQQIMNDVIDILGKSRLVTFDRDPVTRSPTIEVTHEAIIREWKRLRNWLDESRNDVRMQRGLALLSAEWLEYGREDSYLLRGARLESYEKWAEMTNLALTLDEQGYLDQSIAARKREEEAERARQERERQLEQQNQRRLQLLVGVLLAATIIALGLTVVALYQSSQAQQQTQIAVQAQAESEQNAREARSLALEASARQALSENNGDLAVVLALEANRVLDDPPIQAQNTLAEVALAPGTRRVYRGHEAWVQAVDISPDTTRIASGSTDSSVRIWDTVTGEQLFVLRGHEGDVEAVTFSPDGRYVVSGAGGFDAILWDVATGAEVRRFEGHTRPVREAVFSPDGNFLLTASTDTFLFLWDVNTGEIVRRFEGHNASVMSAAIHPDGTRALSGSRDGEMILWDLQTGALLRRFQGHETAVNDIDYSRNGELVISGSGDGTLILHAARSGLIERRFPGDVDEVRSVAFHPDGQTFLSASINGVITVWNWQTGRELYELVGHYTEERDIDPDGGPDVLSVNVSNEGHLAVSGSKDGTIRLWNIGNTSESYNYQQHSERVTSVAVSADGRRIYTSSMDGQLVIWDHAQERVLQQLTITASPINSMALLSDESRAYLGLRSGEIVVYDVSNQAEVGRLRGHEESVLSLSLTPEEDRLLSTDQSGMEIVWDVATGAESLRVQNHDGAAFDAAIHPDGTRALSAGRDNRLLLWDLSTGELIGEPLIGHAGSVYTVAISPDGRLAASGGREGVVVLWDLATGREVARLVGHTDSVWSLAFDPMAQRFVSGSNDGSVILWDIATEAEIQRFPVADPPVFALAFMPDGQLAISGQQSGSVRLWRTFSFERLLGWTESNRYIRDLTCFERSQYVIEPLCPGDADVADAR